MTRVHFLLRNKRRTACGRAAKRTLNDTRDAKRVSCRTCQRSIAAMKRACAELNP